MAGEKFDKANSFIAKLKAYGTDNDVCNLKELYEAYKNILTELPAKDRGSFSLNVLCTLCRNIEKVPKWREKICNAQLLEFSVCCVRQTRILEKTEQVKTLACVYHIHRYLVRQESTLQPALLLKLSYMPFEVTEECLQREHYKVYWSILADRIVYIEKLKTIRNISDLLTKLSNDINTIILIYNPVQFCSSVLMFIIKKLHFLYSDIKAEELMVVYKNIFDSIINKNNIEMFKSITQDEALDIYIKINECLYVMIENESKLRFKGSDLEFVVRKIMLLFGHCSDIFHCFQVIYLDCFCCIFKYTADKDCVEKVLDVLTNNCETAEKLGYKKIMYTTYPFIAQLLRLYIDFFINNIDNIKIQFNCLKIIIYLIDKLNKTQQISKCENCDVKTGLHDALRLTFLTKNIIIKAIEKNLDTKYIFNDFFNIVIKQYTILNHLKRLNCTNYEKCLKKLQADIHNTAIILNKAKFYEYSIKMFNIYLKTEIYYMKNENDYKNIARAFYNKSICEMDCMLYEEAINGAFLSLVLSGDGVLNDKYLSLVMDIKAKALKNDCKDSMQLMTVLTACKNFMDNKEYINLKPFFSSLKFSALLRHEFSMYVKLWPSIVPIAGVWMSLNELSNGVHTWLKVENQDDLLRLLYEVMLETPTAVRTIHSDYYKDIVNEILQRIQEKSRKNIEEKLVEAILLCLKSEYDIAEVTEKYGWKQTDPTLNLEQIKDLRTLPQEQSALKHAVKAVDIWTEILPKIIKAPPSPLLPHSLQIAQVFVQQLLYTQRILQGLQLAHVCCDIARHIGDKKAYINNVGVIIRHVIKPTDKVEQLVATAVKYWQEMVACKQHLDTVLVFACELAMYYNRCGSVCVAEKLLQFVEARILEALEDVNLDLAVGRLLEAHAKMSYEPDMLSRVSAVQRHYVAVNNNETTWTSRRYRGLVIRGGCCAGAVLSGLGARALLLWRRSRSALAAGLRPASALLAAHMYTIYVDTNAEDAEVNIDRIKHILGLQPTNEIQPQTTIHKVEQHTPKHTQIETMLKSSTFRRLQTSPSSPLMTSSFTMPEFLNHNGNCQCYACQVPSSFIIAVRNCVLEASMYFRSKDFQIARNYFDGTSEALKLAEEKLLRNTQNSKFEKYICEIVKDVWNTEIKVIEAEMLLEECYFDLSQNDFVNINHKIRRLDDISKEIKLNTYLENEINNLLIATSRLKTVIKKKEEDALEIEMEHLTLSPNTKLIKTPESKKIPKNTTNKIVKQNELPSLNYKISKLNLDGEEYDEKEPIKEIKKTKFKIPEPVINRPILETMTPGPKTRLKMETPILKKMKSETMSMSKTPLNMETTTPLPKTRVKILLTQASQDQGTPVSKAEEFFTPSSTPAEHFFTPMSSVKTYTRKRTAIVKNLENEFSTPKVETEKENKPSVRTRRAVSSRLNKETR